MTIESSYRKKQINIFHICLSVLVFCSCGIANTEFFVSSHGSDCNPGTESSPIASLHKARDLIREIRADRKVRSDESIVVWIEAGTYELKECLRLQKQDSNTLYKAKQDAKVRLVGGRNIPARSFCKITDQSVLKRISDSNAREHILFTDLKSFSINEFGQIRRYGHMLPVVNAPLELFVNDKPYILAQYPNHGEIELVKIIDKGSVPRIGDYNECGGIFEYTDLRHSRWVGIENIWAQGTFNYGYADDNIRIEWIDPYKRQVKLAGEHMYGLAAGKPYRKYRVYNLLEELDMPGEWYLDRKTGYLYVWPNEDMFKNANIYVSMLEEPMISLEDAFSVTIEGLIIEVARGMGVYIEGGKGNIIRNCTVRNVGTSGIFMGQGAKQTFPHITHDNYEGVPVSGEIGNLQAHIYEFPTWERNAGDEHGIINCVVYNTGSGGVYVSGGSKKNLIPGGSYVTNCLIHDYNRRNKFLWAGVNIDGCGNKVTHCEIYNSDFQGIYVRGNDHLFEYNYLHDLAMDSDDTSAWYIGRDPSSMGNVLRYNFFENIGRPDRMVMGVYLDDGACGVKIHGNIFYKTASRGSVFSNSGHDVKVTNNIFIESLGPAVELNSIFYHMSDAHLAHFFGYPKTSESHMTNDHTKTGMFAPSLKAIYEYRLLECVDIRKPPYSERYPELTDYLDYLDDGVTRVGMRPRNNMMARNVIYKCPKALKLIGPYAQFYQEDNYVTNEDPGFVDVKNKNFLLKKNSVVYQVIDNFEPIAFEKIGRNK